ncbi:MAG: tRNA (adenosine(37)-N6)-dimethylallyltransferase MiaA [Isosphaeraceae bacterium]
MSPFHRALYLTGPTASGKTAVGVILAHRLHAEVIAMDSMTLYRGMDIGTAKPTVEERGGIAHHLIDVLDPWDSASVADYRGWAGAAIEAIEARGRRALFVGGTPLYLKALLRGLFDGPGADPALRSSLEAEADRIGDEAMHARLAGLDPQTAARVHPNDRRRVVRALEVLEKTGRPISDWQRQHRGPAGVLPVFAISRPRALLHDRINRRAEAMFRGGLIDEVRRLMDGPRPLHDVPAQGVGYREVADFLAGRIDQDEALARTQARTRQFAKRQETWFRGLEEVRPHPVDEGEGPERTAEALALRIAEGSP